MLPHVNLKWFLVEEFRSTEIAAESSEVCLNMLVAFHVSAEGGLIRVVQAANYANEGALM